jgi:hypothetical protein
MSDQGEEPRDADEVYGEEEEEPPTPIEQLQMLKDALANGDIGAAVFHAEWQPLWLAVRARAHPPYPSRAARRRASARASCLRPSCFI